MYIGLHVNYPLFSSILIKPEFSRRVFEKYVKFNDNQSTGSQRTEEQTDRHDETNSRFSQFCEFSNHKFFHTVIVIILNYVIEILHKYL
jgi:hypothetical protein